MWDVITGRIDAGDDPLSSLAYKGVLNYKMHISRSLRQLEAMDNPSQATIHHLYLCQEILDQYLRVYFSVVIFH